MKILGDSAAVGVLPSVPAMPIKMAWHHPSQWSYSKYYYRQ